MSTARPLAAPPDPRTIDHFVYLRVGWDDYEKLLAMRGESSVPRITYLNGVVELMSPSSYHELDKKRFARLLEAWSEVAGVELEGYGSWTLTDEEQEVGAEADECYTVGRLAVDDEDRPDVAIEVVWTSGGVNKLEVYRKLGVREVWYFRKGKIQPHVLRGERYEAVSRSEVLPGIDIEQLASFIDRPSTSRAIKEYRAAIRGR